MLCQLQYWKQLPFGASWRNLLSSSCMWWDKEKALMIRVALEWSDDRFVENGLISIWAILIHPLTYTFWGEEHPNLKRKSDKFELRMFFYMYLELQVSNCFITQPCRENNLSSCKRMGRWALQNKTTDACWLIRSLDLNRLWLVPQSYWQKIALFFLRRVFLPCQGGVTYCEWQKNLK